MNPRRILSLVGCSVVFLFITGLMLAAEPAVVDVKSQGATGDGKTKDTAAIQKAINACAAGGGGIVRFRDGTYLSGAVFLKSKVTLQLDERATLKGTQDPADYLPEIATRWEGIERKMPASLVNAIDAEDIAITGSGTIDGSGEYWWKKMVKHDEESRRNRPRLVEFLRCKRVKMKGVTLKDSPNWILHPIYCQDVTLDGLTILAPATGAPNTDGIDPDSCKGMTITRCTIDVGDDCIAVKSGKDADGRRVGKPCEDLVIEHCTMLHGHGGVAIGSEMSGGVRNVIIRDCTFTGTDRGVRLKTTRGRGGVMENITYENIVMKDVPQAIEFTMQYASSKSDNKPRPVDETTPSIRNIRIINVTATGSKSAGSVVGLPESKLTDITLENVKIACEKGLLIRDAKGVTLKNVEIIPKKDQPITKENVE
jgi:polygalacturonase